jgi:hypothetical protein
MWDMFMAYVVTILLAGLKITIFFLCWGLLLMALRAVIRYL